jgi:hypothetical protein
MIKKSAPIDINRHGKAQDSWTPLDVDESYQPTGEDKPSQTPVDIGGGSKGVPPKEKAAEAPTPQPTKGRG